MNVFDIVRFLTDHLSVRDLYCVSATCRYGRRIDTHVRDDNYYMNKVLLLYGVDKFKHRFDKPKELFFTKLYKTICKDRLYTPKAAAMNYLTKAYPPNITMFLALGLEYQGSCEDTALHNSLSYKDTSLLTMMLKGGFKFYEPVDAARKAINSHKIHMVKCMLELIDYSDKELSMLACHSLDNKATCYLLYQIVDISCHVLVLELDKSIKAQNVNATRYILETGRVTRDDHLHIASVCYAHGTSEQMELLRTYDMICTVEFERIYSESVSTHINKTEMYEILLEEQKLLVSDECIDKMICKKDTVALSLLKEFDLLKMKECWIERVILICHDDLIKVMFSCFDDGIVISERSLSVCLSSATAVSILFAHGVDVSSYVLMKRCVYNGYDNTLELLLPKHNYPQDTLNNVLLYACGADYSNVVVKILLEDGRANPSHDDSECLVVACEKGNMDTVKMLLDDYRADPCARMEYALRQAYKRNHTDIVNLFMWNGRTEYTLTSLAALD